MDRGMALMQRFRWGLTNWVEFIRRASQAQDVSLIPEPTGEFTLVVRWHNKEFKKHFTRALVFGSSRSLPEAAWQVERKPCDHARDVVREILEQRGVI